MSDFRIFATAISIGLVLSAGLGAATVAATHSLTTVEIQPRELDTASGRAAVFDRIERAAERFCSEPGITGRQFDRACARQVSARMIEQAAKTRFGAETDRLQSLRIASRT